jgi:L-rhamnose isomerase
MVISHSYLAIDLGTESGRTMLLALLEPSDMLKGLEAKGDFSSRLALREELKAMTSNAVWDYYCIQKNAPSAWTSWG